MFARFALFAMLIIADAASSCGIAYDDAEKLHTEVRADRSAH